MARALESGAADYIVKPFSPTELVARVRAALRVRAEPELFVLGDLAIDHARHRVCVAGREIPLTAMEFRVAASALGQRRLPRDLRDRATPGLGGAGFRRRRAVRAFVKNLRRKLGDDASDPAWFSPSAA